MANSTGFSMQKVITAILLAYGCALAWVIYADVVYNNQVAIEDFAFSSLYGISLALSAIAAALLYDKNVKSLALRKCKWKYIGLGIGIAVFAIFIPFLLNLLAKVTGLQTEPKFDMELLIGGLPIVLILALAEEVMWRGILYSELSKKYNFAKTSIIIGLLWALWHYPVIIHTKFIYADRPLWFVLPAFTAMVVSGSFVYNYLRRISGSIWPCVFLHAGVNYLVFGIIEPLEKAQSANAMYFMNDIGVFYVLVFVAGAFVVNRKIKAIKNRMGYPGIFDIDGSFHLTGRGIVIYGDIIEGIVNIENFISFNIGEEKIKLKIKGVDMMDRRNEKIAKIGLTFNFEDAIQEHRFATIKVEKQKAIISET